MKYLYKDNNTDRLGSVLLTTDTELTFPLLPNSTYVVRGQLRFKGSTPGGVKHGFTAGGATILQGSIHVSKWRSVQTDATTEADTNCGLWTQGTIMAGITKNIAMITGAYSMPIKFSGLLDIGDTGGDFGITFAQYTADGANPATLLAGSILIYEKLP
jgi:hypothetical protein